MNTTFGKLAVGDVFLAGHNSRRSKNGAAFVKVDETQCGFFIPPGHTVWSRVPVHESGLQHVSADSEVTYIGCKRVLLCTHKNTRTRSRGMTGMCRETECTDCGALVDAHSC